MHVTNHTRVECRVLCALARGGKVRELRAGVYDTGEKRDPQGRLKHEFVEAGGAKANFRGVKVTFGQDLLDRLQDAGLVTQAGNISAAGREYLAEVHTAARSLMADEKNPKVNTAEAVAEHGFMRPGMSTRDCCAAAHRIADVIERLKPQEADNG